MAGYSYNKYGDELARKKRRRFFIKLLLIFLGLIGLASIVIYLLFFSKILQIKEVSIEGLKTLKSEEILTMVNSEIERDFLNPFHIKLQRNILFFEEESIKSKLLSEFSTIKDLEIEKEYPHKLVISVEERTAIGTWCFNEESLTDLTSSCQLFDDSGFLWGSALKSSGNLLLVINDMRSKGNDSNRANNIIGSIKNIVTSLNNLNIRIKNIEIPDDPLSDLKIYTNQNYYIFFNSGPDIDKQLESLKIFITEQNSDFHPEYIDARIAGRVYYK